MSKRLFVPSQREAAALHRIGSTVAKDVPRPAPEPYSSDDQIRIYLNPADSDAYTYDTVCEILGVLEEKTPPANVKLAVLLAYRLQE